MIGEVTIEDVIKGDYSPHESYIRVGDKDIFFGDLNDSRDRISINVIGLVDGERFIMNCEVSIDFLKQEQCIPFLISQWMGSVNRRINK